MRYKYLLAPLLAGLIMQTARGDSQGPYYPAQVASEHFKDINNAKTCNESYAYCDSNDASLMAPRIDFWDYKFTISAGNIIDSVRLNETVYLSVATLYGPYPLGVFVGTFTPLPQSGMSYYSNFPEGSPGTVILRADSITQNWNPRFTPANIDSVEFGVMVYGFTEFDHYYDEEQNPVDSLVAYTLIDCPALTVYYHSASAPPDSLLSASADSVQNNVPVTTDWLTAYSVSGTSWTDATPSQLRYATHTYATYTNSNQDILYAYDFRPGVPDYAYLDTLYVRVVGHGGTDITKRTIQIGISDNGNPLNGMWHGPDTLTYPDDTTMTFEIAPIDTIWGFFYHELAWTDTAWGIIIRNYKSDTQELDIDQVLTKWKHRTNNDTVSVTFHDPDQANDSSVVFAATGYYPDTEFYDWRFAWRFQKDTTATHKIVVTVSESDTVFFTGYVLNNSGGYSAPFYFKKYFASTPGQPVYQDSTGWKAPGQVRLNGWTPLADSILTSDDRRVHYAGTTRGRMVLDRFGFTVPSNTRIVGIGVKDEGNGAGSNALARTMQMYLSDKDSVINGTTRNDTLASATDAIHIIPTGSASYKAYLWNPTTTWTPAIINSNNFAVVIYDYNTTNNQLNLDQVQVCVFFEYLNNTKLRKLKQNLISGD